MRRELNRFVVAPAGVLVVCLSLCRLGFAKEMQIRMDRNLIEGVFVGDANLPEPPVNERFAVYEGPLPEDQDPSFWDLRGDHRGNAWFRDYLTEEHVMSALLRHFDESGEKDWEIGIGTGGQLYSWRGPWGELLPPQFGPWVDEVWQANSHSTEAQAVINAIYENDPRETNLRNTVGRAFVQASASLHDKAPPGKSFFPSPMVARWYDPEGKSYTVVNLAISPTLPTLIYHRLLIYTRYRYVGDGVLEVTTLAYNFGEYTYPYGGIPWGGVRTTVFPNLFVSRPDGSYAGAAKVVLNVDGKTVGTREVTVPAAPGGAGAAVSFTY